MFKAIMFGVGAAAVAVLGAATAEATPAQFNQRAQATMPYVVAQYGGPAVLAEGYRVCRYEAQGVTGASPLADLIVADMPMSRTMSIQLQVLAENYLGC